MQVVEPALAFSREEKVRSPDQTVALAMLSLSSLTAAHGRSPPVIEPNFVAQVCNFQTQLCGSEVRWLVCLIFVRRRRLMFLDDKVAIVARTRWRRENFPQFDLRE